VPELFAICEHCNEPFGPGLLGEEVGGLTVVRSDLVVKPTEGCPRCGGTGKSLEAARSIEQVTRILLAPGRKPRDVEQLVELLLEFQKQSLDKHHIEDEIARRAPRFYGLVHLLPQDKSELYALLSLVVAVATLIVDSYSVVSEERTTSALEAAISKAIRENATKQGAAESGRSRQVDPVIRWKIDVRKSVYRDHIKEHGPSAAYIAFAALGEGLDTTLVPKLKGTKAKSRNRKVRHAVKRFVDFRLLLPSMIPMREEHSVFVFLLAPALLKREEYSVQYRVLDSLISTPPLGYPKLRTGKAFRLISRKLS
jgi:hypothetical protein